MATKNHLVKIAVTILILSAFVLTGCVTSKRCLQKFGGDTTYITLHDTVTVTMQVPVPADSVNGTISKDSLILLLSGKIDSITNQSVDKKLEVTFKENKKTHGLDYKAKQKRDTITVFKKVYITVKGKCPPVIVPHLTWYEKIWNGFRTFCAFVVLGALLVIGIKRLI